MCPGARILLQIKIYRRLQIDRDGHLDQSKTYDILSVIIALSVKTVVPIAK